LKVVSSSVWDEDWTTARELTALTPTAEMTMMRAEASAFHSLLQLFSWLSPRENSNEAFSRIEALSVQLSVESLPSQGKKRTQPAFPRRFPQRTVFNVPLYAYSLILRRNRDTDSC
jgi:hypothetical protein